MKPVTVELPDRVAESLDRMVGSGWFRSDSEAINLALHEFMRRHPIDLIERQQREDIAWALSQKPSAQ